MIDALTSAAREENAACARRLAVIGELHARRTPADADERARWAIDGFDHTLPYPLGPTHPSNLKLLCRFQTRLTTLRRGNGVIAAGILAIVGEHGRRWGRGLT